MDGGFCNECEASITDSSPKESVLLRLLSLIIAQSHVYPGIYSVFKIKGCSLNSLDYKVLNWNGMGWYSEFADVMEALLGLLPIFG